MTNKSAPASDAEIDFVFSCLFHEAISMEELSEWAQARLARPEDQPVWMVSLAGFSGTAAQASRLVPGYPSRAFSPEESKALTGIAWLRGRAGPWAQFREKAASTALEGKPEVMEEFRRTFPFINL